MLGFSKDVSPDGIFPRISSIDIALKLQIKTSSFTLLTVYIYFDRFLSYKRHAEHAKLYWDTTGRSRSM